MHIQSTQTRFGSVLFQAQIARPSKDVKPQTVFDINVINDGQTDVLLRTQKIPAKQFVLYKESKAAEKLMDICSKGAKTVDLLPAVDHLKNEVADHAGDISFAFGREFPNAPKGPRGPNYLYEVYEKIGQTPKSMSWSQRFEKVIKNCHQHLTTISKRKTNRVDHIEPTTIPNIQEPCYLLTKPVGNT